MLKLAVGLDVRFVDTAMASRNEALIAQALAGSGLGSANDVHVQTKVWYTHLGYARTQLAVRNSLANFATSPGPPPTVLLHWPRCRNDVPWMRCEEEESELPEEVKAVGPPPHLQPADAWEGSWAALEDAFLAGDVSNIGVRYCICWSIMLLDLLFLFCSADIIIALFHNATLFNSSPFISPFAVRCRTSMQLNYSGF